MKYQKQAAGSHTTPRWLLIMWLVVIGAALAAQSAPVANASHSDTGSYKKHQALLHWSTGDGNLQGANDEDYCVDSQTGSMSADTAGVRVRDTLVVGSPHWDGTGNWRMDLWKAPSRCTAYTDRNWIELEYRVADNWSGTCGGGYAQYSCVSHYTPIYTSQYNHYHYTWDNSFLVVTHMDGDYTEYRELINHESGHLFGLLDGNGSSDCPGSLMHNRWYGCSNWPNWYPSTGDFNSVVAIMDGR